MSDYFGVYRGSVYDVSDPENRGRLRILVPQVLGTEPSAWSEPSQPPAPKYKPKVNARIWVFFEGGDINRPVYISADAISGDKVLAGTLTADLVTADFGDFITVKAENIQAGVLNADLAVAKSLMVGDVDTDTTSPTYGQIAGAKGIFGFLDNTTGFGLFTFDAAGAPRLELPVNGKGVWRGDAEIDFLTVKTFMTLATSGLAEAAIMTLYAGVTAPGNPASVSVEYEQYQMAVPTLGNWTDRTYVAYDGTYYYTTYDTLGTGIYLEKWNATTGALVTSKRTVTTTGSYACGLFYLSGQVWMLFHNATDSKYYLQTYDPTSLLWDGIYQAIWANNNGDRKPALAYDSATNQIIIAQSRSTNANKVRIQRCTFPASGAAHWGESLVVASSIDTAVAYTTDLTTLLTGSFDFGAVRHVLKNHSAGLTKVFDATGAEVTGEEWPMSTAIKTVGICWDGTRFHSVDESGLATRYESDASMRWTSPTDDTWGVSFAWGLSTGPYTSMASPIQYFQMSKRARVRVSGQSLPVAGTYPPDHVTFYLGKGATAVPTSMWPQPDIFPGAGVVPQVLLTNVNFTTGTHDRASSALDLFPPGVAAKINTTFGGFSVDGNSNGSVGTGTFRDSVSSTAWDNAALAQPWMERYKAAAQALVTGTWTTITFPNTATSDVGLAYAVGVVTVPAGKSGRYMIRSRFYWQGNATNRREARILLNGTTFIDHTIKYAPSTSDEEQHVEALVKLFAGDTIEIQGWQNSGGNLNVAPVAEQGREYEQLQIAYLGV